MPRDWNAPENLQILATGSSGNCILLSSFLSLDMGVPYKTVAPYARGLKAVFISHIHGDHLNRSTVRRLARERPMLRFIAGPFLKEALLECGVDHRRITTVREGRWYRFPTMSIKPEPLRHDVENYGLHIHLADGSKVFYATDTASLEHLSVPGYDLYLVEGNYDREQLEASIARKLESGEFIYEYRSRVTHMDKADTLDWLYTNMGTNSRYVLIHQHKEEKSCSST